MLSLACFVSGRLGPRTPGASTAFVLFSFFALFAYGAFGLGFSGLGAVYDAIFAWIALQLGDDLCDQALDDPRCVAAGARSSLQ